MNEHSDEQLVVIAHTGDQAAIGELYDRYAVFVYRWIYARVGHRQESEDLTAECMVRMVEALPQLETQTRFRGWLFGLVRHVVADFWRKRYALPQTALPDELQDHGPEPDPIDEGRWRAEAEKVLAELPETYRQVLQHRFFNQDTLVQTAAAMQTTVGNVKVLQHRALKKAAELAQRL